ncbi:hypothetical protein V8C86DRAFT_3130508 [Haematococcus lacustris]
MANPVLLRSTLAMGTAHLVAMLLWLRSWANDPLLVFVYQVGLLTSLLNHGLTHPAWVWLDRAWMALGCTVDLTRILALRDSGQQAVLLALQATLVAAFFVAKYLIARSAHKPSGNGPHLVTHLGASVLHVWLLRLAAQDGTSPGLSHSH